MSICPSKDLFSDYLDDELPPVYKKELEEHLLQCPACQKYLDNLKKLSSAFNKPVISSATSQQFLDQSFERLQTKMKYSKNTGRVIRGQWPVARIVGAVAAAAVFALVLPYGIKISSRAPVVDDTVFTMASAFDPIGKTVMGQAVSTMSPNKAVKLSGNVSPDLTSVFNQAAQSVSFKNGDKNLIKDVDVFTPNFDNGSTISIKITMPGQDSVPVITEVKLPMASVMGFVE